MAARPNPATSRTRLETVAVIVGSAVVMVVVIAATEFFGLGVHTSYGSGIDSALGNQVTHDFLADQDAEAAALSRSDQSLLDNRLSDSALADVIQQIQNQSSSSPPTVSFQPSSLTVLRAQDYNDPTLLIEVQEDGTKTITSGGGQNSAPTESDVAFHGNFWLRNNGGRYTIADQDIQTLPTSYLPQVALVVVVLIWVAVVYVLYRRTRPISATRPPAAAPASPSLASEPPVDFDRFEPASPEARTTIRTFGGLQVLEDGRDWAPELVGRQVMAFVWRRVLLAPIEDPAASVARDTVARQSYPSVEREYQLGRLRTVLNQGLPQLPPPLRRQILQEPKVLRFNLEDCSVDALELVKLSNEWGGLKTISPSQAARARRVIDASRSTFLPEFESVDDQVTSGRPTCTGLITDLRAKLAARRRHLFAVLGRTYLAGRRPDLAIGLLEPAVEDYPGDTPLRDLLADARRASEREADARSTAMR